MKTLHTYLVRQVLGSLLTTVAVFTFVMLLGNVLKEILGLLVNQQVSFGTVLVAVGYLIPFSLVFALPMGLLTATLLTFGRFSADNELTAVRASGISLLSLITPILLLSVALSGVCALINLHVAPQCRLAYKQLIFRSATDSVEALLQPRTFIREFPPYTVYFSRRRGTELRDIDLYEMDRRGSNVLSVTHARSASFSLDLTNRRVHLVLKDVWNTSTGRDRPPVYAGEAQETLEWRQKAEKGPSLSELTFFELREKRLELQRAGIPTLAVDVKINALVAFSFACVGFTLIGIPLGIRAHRRETSAGIAMALVLVLLFYGFLILGQSLDSKPHLYPWLIVWLPNFAFQALGLILLRKMNRGV